MKLIVLGSNSFAGACFVNRALNEADAILAISRSPEPIDFFLPFKGTKSYLDKVKSITLDINKNYQDFEEILKKFEPNIIVDFAGQGMVAPSWNSPWEWYTTNLVSKSRFLKDLQNSSYLEKYIRISTPEVYGDFYGRIKEDTPLNPSTPYAVSHAAIDFHLKALSSTLKFPMLIGRFANFYGPTQQLYRIIPRTILSILSNSKLPLHGGGNSFRCFIHGDDVAEGIMAMINKGVFGCTYHFSSNKLISIKNLVELICDKMEKKFENVVERCCIYLSSLRSERDIY